MRTAEQEAFIKEQERLNRPATVGEMEAVMAENAALKAALVNKGVITEADVEREKPAATEMLSAPAQTKK